MHAVNVNDIEKVNNALKLSYQYIIRDIRKDESYGIAGSRLQNRKEKLKIRLELYPPHTVPLRVIHLETPHSFTA